MRPPIPKLVVAVGDCAKHCGVFKGSYADRRQCGSSHSGRRVSVPGCPPEPTDILRGILAALMTGRTKSDLVPTPGSIFGLHCKAYFDMISHIGLHGQSADRCDPAVILVAAYALSGAGCAGRSGGGPLGRRLRRWARRSARARA